MNEERGTKRCKMCFEEMDARARRCPHCGHWQWRNAWALFLPSALLLVLFLVFMMILQGRFVQRMEDLRREPDDVGLDGRLEVTQSEMFFGESKDGPTVFVVGKIKNEGDVTWEYIPMDVEFRDAAGKLIDVQVESHYLYRILPGGEMAFKFRGMADLPRERYASYAVSIVSADDARASPW